MDGYSSTPLERKLMQFSKSLIDIGKNYNTDKTVSGFVQIYEDLFANFRNTEKSILEIGINRGDSLRMWREYFPKARIMGADIRQSTLGKCGKGVETYYLDQSSRADLCAFSADKNFVIIIDDGGHVVSHQILTFEVLWPHINSGGLYIIEDIETSYWTDSKHNYVDSHPTCVEYFKNMIFELNSFGQTHKTETTLYQKTVDHIRFYPNMIVIKKK